MYPRNLNLASNHNYTFWMKTNKQTKQNRKKKKRRTYDKVQNGKKLKDRKCV